MPYMYRPRDTPWVTHDKRPGDYLRAVAEDLASRVAA